MSATEAATPGAAVAARDVDCEVAIVGSGFAGLGMAIELKRSGRDDFVLLERAESVGGTWRDNHYPGCACDIPTPLYSFSFAPNPEWSHLYAHHDEIRAYLERCADDFDVRRQIRFGNGAARADWEEEAQRWRLSLDDGSSLTARVLVGGIGGLNRPSMPEIEGLETFAGPVVHSAAWDDGLDFVGKRVAVIGTGASAIQLVPKLAEAAARLTVLQRTAPWVLPRPDFEIPRWMKALFRRFPLAQRALRGLIYGLQESVAIPINNPPLTRIPELIARLHLRRGVPDPELRRRLTPTYKVGCKRILTANDYYPALSRDNVELVTESISRITPEGVECADGTSVPCDVLVCATGFDIREAFAQIDLRGREGVTLTDLLAKRIEAHRGTMVTGFPNLLVLSGPNTGTGNMSQVFMIEAQLQFAKRMLEAMEQRGIAAVEVRPEAQEAYNAELLERMEGTVWLTGGCASWYLTDEGHTGVLYPGYSSEFRRSLREFRAEEYELTPSRRSVTSGTSQQAETVAA